MLVLLAPTVNIVLHFFIQEYWHFFLWSYEKIILHRLALYVTMGKWLARNRYQHTNQCKHQHMHEQIWRQRNRWMENWTITSGLSETGTTKRNCTWKIKILRLMYTPTSATALRKQRFWRKTDKRCDEWTDNMIKTIYPLSICPGLITLNLTSFFHYFLTCTSWESTDPHHDSFPTWNV